MERAKNINAHIIRQIENGLADWSKDFGKVERVEINSVNITKTQRKKRVLFFYCSHFQRKKCSHTLSHDGKIKGVERFLQHICAQ